MSSKHYVYSWNIIDESGILHPFCIGVGHNTNGYYSRSYVKHCYSKNNKTRAQYKREKYEDNFYIVIEYDNLILSEREILEKKLISEYGTIDNHGVLYNHTEGGDFNPMFDEKIKEKWLSKITSDEHREKRRKAQTNNWKKEEYRNKCESKIKTRERNEFGQFKSDKPIEEIYKNMITCQKTRIEVVINGIKYPSVRAASRLTGLTVDHIRYWVSRGRYI